MENILDQISDRRNGTRDGGRLSPVHPYRLVYMHVLIESIINSHTHNHLVSWALAVAKMHTLQLIRGCGTYL